jgi:two-component system, OmpR family, sensor histidine kinase TctE
MSAPRSTSLSSPHPTATSSDLDARLAQILPTYSTENEPAPQRSLFGEILDWMLAPLLLLWPMSIAVTYLVAQSIANAPFDRALESSAAVLAQQVRESAGRISVQLPIPAREILRADEADLVFYQVLGTRGEFLVGDRDLPLPPDDEPIQPGSVRIRDDRISGNDIRVASMYVEVKQQGISRQVLVQVAETLDKRSQLANDIIKGVIIPQFVILPVAVILVWFGLARGLAPLTDLQYRIRNRKPDDTSPIDAKVAPQEIMPLVASFNDLLKRLDESVSVQKRFIADAAHQMKTPLAGLRMQAELAMREQNPEQLRRSLAQIAESSERATHLVSQLLALARMENQRVKGLSEDRVDISALARSVVLDALNAAWNKDIDLGYEGPDDDNPLWMQGQSLMLKEMLSNLVDNAIRYTPNQGHITVRVALSELDGALILEVEDSGPGIPLCERERVLERFYRVLGNTAEGSGLGLAIVKEIVDQHEGRLEILTPQKPSNTSPSILPGCLFRVTLPPKQHHDSENE